MIGIAPEAHRALLLTEYCIIIELEARTDRADRERQRKANCQTYGWTVRRNL